MASGNAEFKLRNVHCETSMDFIDDFARLKYGKNAPKELKTPVIRMFGICDNGEKCLANIYGFLPFFYLRTRSEFSPDVKNQIGKLVVKCAKLLDIELTIGVPLLADVEPVEFKDLYGYYSDKEQFIKVIFYDHIICHRIGITLQKECGKNEMIQPYYVHINYLLQFFIEYDIAGMGVIRWNSKNVRFRRISDEMLKIFPDAKRNFINCNSQMANEVDVFSDDIIMERTLSMKTEYQITGLESIWKEEETRYRLRNDQLRRPTRPEWGVPELKTEKEETRLKILQQLFNEYINGDPNFSQIISEPRSVDFSQTEELFDEVDKAELSIYVEHAIEGETNDEIWNQNEIRENGGPDETEEANLADDNAQHLEMTQLASKTEDSQKTETISSDDEEEYGTLIEKNDEVEPEYPPVCFIPNQEKLNEYSEDYTNPQSNETWCADEDNVGAKNSKAEINFESPIKMNSAQKEAAEKFKNACSVSNLTVFSVEALFQCNKESINEKSDKASEKKYIPNPETDECIGIFYCIYTDICNKFDKPDHMGACVIEGMEFSSNEFSMIKEVRNEGDLFRWIALILRQYDPDIIIGYDIKRLSFNYIIQRAAALGIQSFNEAASRLSPRWDNDIRKNIDDLRGRIFLNIWKIVRRENPMRHYRMSAVVDELLKRRFVDMSQFFIEKLLNQNDEILNAVVFRHFFRKTSLNVQILVALDMFIRTSQMSLVYGIQFTDVLTRGSQFRVESMLLRLAKVHEFCPPSVSIEQRNSMPSPETIPLTMEPRSGIYYDPVVVLDFQSLYPSVCIAYNYCFSTCLGTVEQWQNHLQNNKSATFRLGALPYDPPMVEHVNTLRKEGKLTVSPVGGIFVKKEVRKSVVAMMLEELLETRVMVKTSMKKYKDEVLKRLLDARQLALKLIANVTYGYTAANWSGRMPCAEVADAIVSKGREALERAIKMVEEDVNGEYDGAQVLYGDTDSLFILMPNKSKADAFRIGRKIADDVTAENPYPMKLKFEKVMMPCCLLAKKRYVGMSYEAEEDQEGIFDAKGIETVRRDSCEFVSNSMKIILQKIFDSDYNGVMKFLHDTVDNIDKIPLHQFIISGDYRGNYAESAVLPVKKIAEQLEKISPFHAPVHGDRIEFIVAEPPPQRKAATVFECVFRLARFIEIPELRIHYTYYINRKLLPALARIFQLIPLRVHWFPNNTEECLGCGLQGDIWCDVCIENPRALQGVIKAAKESEAVMRNCLKLCQNCIHLRPDHQMNVPCYNVNCSVWEDRYKIQYQNISDKIKGHCYRTSVKHLSLPNIIE